MVISQEMIEREMGYRGSKSITGLNIPQTLNRLVIVKEQRVDGYRYIKYSTLEVDICYIFKVYSN